MIKTYVRYSEIVSQHLVESLGDYDMNTLTPLVLQRFVTKLLQNGNLKTGLGLSPNSVNAIISVIQNSLRTAYNLGYTEYYAADKIKRPKADVNQVTCFSGAEQKKIEQAVLNGTKSQMLGIVLCLYSGIRLGELLALEWKDIDFVKGELRINKTCYDGKTDNGVFGRITNLPKTSSSLRVIPLPKQLVPILRSLRKQSQSKYVVSNGKNAVTVRSYQRSFERLLNTLKISRKSFHSLRHTFATRALECGMDVKTLSEILGHKNPSVTLSRYAHSMSEYKKEMMNKVGKLL